MRGRQVAGVLVGTLLASLGLLWFLQGMGVLRMRPILCVAHCKKITGRSPLWAAAGAVAFTVGAAVAVASVRGGAAPPPLFRARCGHTP